MKNSFLSLLAGGLLLGGISLFLSSCEKENDPIYEGYGLVHKQSDHSFSVTLDDGTLIYPQEYSLNPCDLLDSTRLYMQFNLLEERDSCAHVRLTYADTILTKSVLPYHESILDSVGNAPVKITHAWFAHGFLNFEFMFAGRAYLNANHAHMLSLLQCPSEGNKLIFEFHHNDFNDRKDKMYIGVVSFRIHSIVGNLSKPIPMVIKYQDSANSTRTINLTYK